MWNVSFAWEIEMDLHRTLPLNLYISRIIRELQIFEIRNFVMSFKISKSEINEKDSKTITAYLLSMFVQYVLREIVLKLFTVFE